MVFRWRSTLTGWLTVNSDGSVLQPSRSATAGGVLRDGQDRLLGAYSMNLGRCTITRAARSYGVHFRDYIWRGMRGTKKSSFSLTP
ncbi:unnamed protein product [Linum trigynum]|uniref:Uncharacterized protein n=1 Tax=Linum trigynum TaxID=586398 RepID=A0AAV2DXR5_9ROSI